MIFCSVSLPSLVLMLWLKKGKRTKCLTALTALSPTHRASLDLQRIFDREDPEWLQYSGLQQR